MNETYLNYLKVEFCRYYELSPEYIEKVWCEAEEPGQDDLNTYMRAYKRLKKEANKKKTEPRSVWAVRASPTGILP